jgi:hypothetical protein
VHTHYYAVFAVAAHGAYMLFCRRPALRARVLAQLGVAAGFLPWLYLHYRLLSGRAVDQVQDLSLANLGAIVRQGALAFTVGATFPAPLAGLGWIFGAADAGGAGAAAVAPLEPHFWALALLKKNDYARANVPMLPVALQWQAAARMSVDYTVFTHVSNSNGVPVAQLDSQPASGTRPTTTWTPDETIEDRRAVLLPADLPVGQYTVEIGLYDLNTGQRLVLADGSDHIVLGTIKVAP